MHTSYSNNALDEWQVLLYRRYPGADLLRWLGGDPFIQIGRHAVVNLQAIERGLRYRHRTQVKVKPRRLY